MAEESSYRAALELALRKLKTKDRFEAELRQLLSEFPSDDVERVITYLKGRRIIDDRRSIVNLIDRYSGKRSVGIEKLRAELNERGAPEETINEALGEAVVGDRQRMLEVLAAKFSPEDGSRAKAARLLFSRGFAEDEIEGVLDCFFRT